MKLKLETQKIIVYYNVKINTWFLTQILGTANIKQKCVK